MLSGRVADPGPAIHFNADPDPDPDSEPDPDPAPVQRDGNMRPLDYRPSTAPFLAYRHPF